MVLSVEDITERTSSGSRDIPLSVTRASEHYSSRRVLYATGFLWSGQSDPSRNGEPGLLIHEMLLQERFANWIRKSVAKRNLATFLYQKWSPTGSKQSGRRALKLARLGFVVNQERVLAEDMEQIWDFIQSSSASRGSSLRYRWIVIKVNDLAVPRRTRLYRKSSKWAVAYKFPAEKEAKFYQSIGRLDGPESWRQLPI